MSIIYDALKKSQKARTHRAQSSVVRLPQLPRLHRKQVILMLVTLICLSIILALALTGHTNPSNLFGQSASAQKSTPLPAPLASAPRLMLEGVFLSENERLAMINHHTYHEGDHVNGLQVVNIAFDQVTLQNKNRSVTLRSALTQFD